MDNGHPSLQRNLAPEETQVYQNAEQDCALCGGPGSSWLASQTCTLPRLESAEGFVRVGIQRHLFGYPGAGPGSWKRIASTVL